MNWQHVLTAGITLFAIIDVPGSIPYLMTLRKREGCVDAIKATFVATGLMLLFLFSGSMVLDLFGISIHAFALAGGVIILASAIELIFGVSLFKEDSGVRGASSIVPVAFPMLAGAGTFTTILSMKTSYESGSIVAAILLNSAIIFLALSSLGWLDKKLSPTAFVVIRKVFGIIVLAIGIQMLYTHLIHVTNGTVLMQPTAVNF